MADTDILVSEMTPASQINTTDLMIMTQPDAQAETGYSTKSGTVLQVANKMLKGTEYSTDLPDFTDKTPLGGLEELKADIKALLPVDSASGNPCNFETGISDKLVSLKASILASGGNGTPSTPIPIVGHSELNLVRCGKNLARSNYSSGASKTTNGVTFKNNNGVVNVSAITATGTAYYDLYSNSDGERLQIKAGTYTVSCAETTSNCTISFALVGSEVYVLHNITHSVTFTAIQDTEMYAYIRVSSGTTNINLDLHFQIELGSTPSAYAPYNGTPYLASFGQTVYGGEYDANAGKVRLNWGMDDLGTFDWYEVSQRFNTTSQLPNAKSGNYIGCLCSIYETRDDVLSRVVPFSICIANNGYCYIYDTRFNDEASFKAAMNGIMVAYELATPIEIDVQAIFPSAVVGTNNIVSDGGGDIEVQYRDSIQHYIDSKIASVQALIL